MNGAAAAVASKHSNASGNAWHFDNSKDTAVNPRSLKGICLMNSVSTLFDLKMCLKTARKIALLVP